MHACTHTCIGASQCWGLIRTDVKQNKTNQNSEVTCSWGSSYSAFRFLCYLTPTLLVNLSLVK